MDRSIKESLLRTLRERLKSEFDTVVAAQRATQEAATHEEAKPENDKDTRALEQSYLARGQAARVIGLQEDLKLLASLVLREFNEESQAAVGALVGTIDESGAEQLYFLAPAGAGQILELGAETVKVVTPSSPLGKSLLGARIDDEIQVRSPSKIRTLSITRLE